MMQLKRFIKKPINKKIASVRRRASARKAALAILGRVAKYMLGTTKGREAIFRALPENEIIIAKTEEGLSYAINSSDSAIGRYVYSKRKSYDAENLINALTLIPEQKSILLDVGANVGTIGILGVAHKYFEKCIAFEPEPNNFKLLKCNVILNGLESSFDLRNEAVSSVAGGEVEFEISDSNFGDHRVRVKNDPGRYNETSRKVISVKTTSLDSAINAIEIKKCILFMDTQGHEGHVLSGGKKLVKNSVPIVTEFWPYGLERSGGLNLFYKVLSDSPYTAMWDLKNPTEKFEFSVDEIKKIAARLGAQGDYTDLLLLDERQ